MPKCSTSALFEAISASHPLITSNCEGLRFKEPQWWTRNPANQSLEAYLIQTYGSTRCSGQRLSPLGFKSPLRQISSRPDMLFLDGSVQLIWEPRLNGYPNHRVLMPEVLRLVQPSARLITVLRDPTERLWSEFTWFSKAEKLRGNVSGTFGRLASQGLALVERCHCSALPCTPESLVGIYRGQPLSAREGCAVTGQRIRSRRRRAADTLGIEHAFKSEDEGLTTDLTSAPGTKVWIGLYWLYIREWRRVFPLDQLLVLETSSIWCDKEAAMQRIHSFLGLPLTIKDSKKAPRSLRSLKARDSASASFASSVKTTRIEGHMSQDTENRLRDFYAPFNIALAALLGDNSFRWDT